MSSRTLIGFAVALVVLAGLAAFGRHNFMATNGTESGALFMPGLKAKLNQVDRVQVVRAGSKPIATLVREKGGWVLANKDNYPADISKIRSALVGLADAHIVEQKTSNPDFYSRLGVEPVSLSTATGTELDLEAGKKSVAKVTIGKASGTNYRYVRNGKAAASYLIDQSLEVPIETASWAVSDIVDLDGKKVRQVAITRANGETLTISKAKAGQQNFTVENLPKGRELRYPGVANVIGDALHELKLQDVAAVAGNETPNETPPEVTSVYKTFDGLVVTVQGTKNKGGDAWIQVTASVDPGYAAAVDEKGAKTGAADAPPADTAAEPPSAAASDEASGSTTASAGDTQSAADDTAKQQPATPDPQKAADAINARVHGWRYRIATYQYDQITRSMDDLLKAEDKPDKKVKK